MNKRQNIWVWVGLSLAVMFLFSSGVGFAVDILWFEEMGYRQVFQSIFFAQLTIGLAEGLAAFVFLYANFRWALSAIGDPVTLFPPEMANTPLRQVFNRRFFHMGALIFSGLTGLLVGSTASGNWEDWLLFLNGPAFGQVDPVFQKDISFYVFQLPVFQALEGLAWAMGLLSLAGTGFLYFLKVQNEKLSAIKGPFRMNLGDGLPDKARLHLAGLGAYLLVILAWGLYLDRFEQMYDQSGLFAGPGYADMEGTLPMLALKAAATLLAAGLVAVGILRQKFKLFVGGLGLVVAAYVGGSLYTTGLQKFVVSPNESAKEAPYLAHHIKATNQAYGLDQVEERSLGEKTELSMGDVERNRGTINNVRLWDHEPLLDTFSQIQEIRTYYEFVSVDNDRYMINGELRQTMLSPREMQKSSLPSRTWVNERMTYTHGYGATMGPVNRVNEQGLPVLFVQDLPPSTPYPQLAITRPEIYYGELVSDYVFVKTNQKEFNYPEGEKNIFSTYDGNGGVKMDSFFKQVLFALHLKDIKILLAEDFTPETRIMLHRNVGQRINRIAPFFHYDADPYMVIHQGRMVWVFDGYTLSGRYPYAAGMRGVGNYMRNPIKVTVDAFDGKVNFYLVDPSDPIAQGYARMFPGMIHPISDMDPGLRAHLRHPVGYFSVQAAMYATYHMLDPVTFYNKEDQWEVPVIGQKGMEPYYTVMKLPGEKKEEFILMLPFTPRLKDNLAAWMVARSDSPNLGRLVVYRFPKQKLVYGPKQIVDRIQQDPLVSQQLTLWDQAGSNVIRGTLLVIPIESSLVYIQPIYLKATGGKIPELKRVIVGYQNEIAMGNDLEDALSQIFSGKRRPGLSMAMPSAADQTANPSSGAAGQAMQHYDAMIRAARSGEWARFGTEQEKLGEALRKLAGKK